MLCQPTLSNDSTSRSDAVHTRLAIVCTHPIQYFSPVFENLVKRDGVEVKVFYGWRGLTAPALDRGFNQSIAWDIPLLDGYEHEFIDNMARDPGSDHYGGIDLPELIPAIEQWRADAVLVYGWRFKAHLQAMRYFKGRIPVLFRGDSTLLDERAGIRTWLRRRVLRWVYRHVDVALYVGSHNRDYFLAHGLRPNQLIFAPHAVDNNRFAADSTSEKRAVDLRNALGIGTDDLVLLLPGKLESKKAPDLLLRSFANLSDRNIHLLIAGSGELETKLKAQAAPNVHFLGFQNQSQMPAAYCAADLVTLPSRGPGETWGLAVNEAMACGRPVLVSDRVGAAIDLVRPGENGWIFTSDSEIELTAALRSAIDKGRAGLAAMGQKSRAIIADWSIEKQVNGILTALALCEANRA